MAMTLKLGRRLLSFASFFSASFFACLGRAGGALTRAARV